MATPLPIPIEDLRASFAGPLDGGAVEVAHEYKFRAGCKADAERFAEKAGVKITLEAQFLEFDGRRIEIPDVEGAFTTATEGAELRRVARSIEGCHVLAGALRRSVDYTGERLYT